MGGSGGRAAAAPGSRRYAVGADGGHLAVVGGRYLFQSRDLRWAVGLFEVSLGDTFFAVSPPLFLPPPPLGAAPACAPRGWAAVHRA